MNTRNKPELERGEEVIYIEPERLKQLRAELHLSQSKFAARIHKTAGYIANAEAGRAKISEYALESICEQFGVNKDWLVDGEGEMFLSIRPSQSHPHPYPHGGGLHPHNGGKEINCGKEMAGGSGAGENGGKETDCGSDVGQRLKQVRKSLKLTQKEFAEKIGYSKMHVFAVENRKVNPSHEYLTKIVTGFGISKEWLFHGIGEMSDQEIDERLVRFLKANPDVVDKLILKFGL